MKDALLWKRILHQGILHPPGLEWLQNRIVVAPILLYNHVWIGGDNYPYDWTKFTACSVPFVKSFWIECPTAEGVNVGALVTPIRLPQNDWRIRILQVGYCGSRAIAGGACFVGLNKNGDLHDASTGTLQFYGEVKQFIESSYEISAIDHAQGYVDMVLSVLLLMGCKNVEIEKRDPDRKQTRLAEKRFGPVSHGYRYHVLVCRPSFNSSGSSSSIELGTTPLHLCRGHFAEYGPEFNKGMLFGKYSGRFYIPPHMKGDKKNGIVEKDYSIPAL